jgi:hypothetical protein
VTYVEPIGPVTGLTEFSYINCEGDPVDSFVGDGITFFPTSRNVCAQEDTIILNGGDESATVIPYAGLSCCISFFPAGISGTPNSFDGCAATLDTVCWVSNISGAPGVEMTSSSSVVYANSSGTILFPGLGGTNQYKIKITGSSICTSNAVASNGDVTPLLGICASC